MSGFILQNIWVHSYGGRYVSKHGCSMVRPKYIIVICRMWFIWCVWVLHLDSCLEFVFYGRYFFAEVFDFFRNFFLIVFHVNILFMVLPLAIRLNHRPCFLAFVYIAISSMLKSYPSVSSFFLHRYSILPRYIYFMFKITTFYKECSFSFTYCGAVALDDVCTYFFMIWRDWHNVDSQLFFFLDLLNLDVHLRWPTGSGF